MGFEVQKFTEADQPQYDSFKLRNTLNTFKYPQAWVVDKEREAYLISFGGQGYGEAINDHPPNYYALIWGAHVITFEARYKVIEREGFVEGSGGPRHIAILQYQLARSVVPHAIRDQWTTIVLMVRDALLANERGLSKYPFDDVLVVPDIPMGL